MLALTAVMAKLLAVLSRRVLGRDVRFQVFFLCQKSNLKEQSYLLGSSSYMETKLILVRECKKFEGPGRAGEEN